jgi:ATP-binding cassette subfamily F protein uup
MINYLQIDNVSKSYGDLVLFENISFQLAKGRKIALVARNGAGKSTLFNLLSGKDKPDTGIITFLKDISIGFLEQDPEFDPQHTVLEQVFNASGVMMQAIAEYELSLETGKGLQQAMEKMDALSAWDYEARIKKILSQLDIHDFDRKMGTLSGGQRKRVALANALIMEPDLLILDEPTNHLDLDMIEWLEDYLKRTQVTLFMVTHDRYFLNRVCTEVVELDNRQLYWYEGNYTDFLEKREERLANESTQLEKAKNLFRKELEWIRRQPKARTHKATYRVDAFEDLKVKASGKRTDKNVKIHVEGSRLGRKVIHCKGLNKSFGNIKVLRDFNYNFGRYEKVGIIGNNGSGKTTLLNMLTGALQPDSGTIEIGETVKFGYYDQQGIVFDPGMKVIELAQSIAEVVHLGNGQSLGVSQFLNQFLFPPEKQHDFISKLSGGEKRRLYLSTILMRNPNFLILDEPTNDLDILTLNVLEEYLQEFKGTVIVVSHDRYFIDKSTEHVLVFEKDGRVIDFAGNYSVYRDYKLAREAREKKAAANLKKESRSETQKTIEKKLSYKEQREFEQLASEIESLENELKEQEAILSNAELHHTEVLTVSTRISELMAAIEIKTNRWIDLGQKLE